MIKHKLNVLSLFDGISCARVAIENLGFDVNYYASEVDKHAISVAVKNYPNTIQIGDVRNVKIDNLPKIDLLIGGSPCQDLSLARANRKGLNGEHSGLFWEYLRILKEVNPKYFILENVNSMPKEARHTITAALCVEPIMIDAALVSAQRRKRLFWTNIPNVQQPTDRNILLKDILQNEIIEQEKNNWIKWLLSESGQKRINMGMLAINPKKAITLKARDYACWSGNYVTQKVVREQVNHNNGVEIINYFDTAKLSNAMPCLKEIRDGLCSIRKLTPIECERLQSLPDNYTSGISNAQRYRCIGNAFNVDVVKHILSYANFLE